MRISSYLQQEASNQQNGKIKNKGNCVKDFMSVGQYTKSNLQSLAVATTIVKQSTIAEINCITRKGTKYLNIIYIKEYFARVQTGTKNVPSVVEGFQFGCTLQYNVAVTWEKWSVFFFTPCKLPPKRAICNPDQFISSISEAASETPSFFVIFHV